jgi:hypothetical protein
MRSVPTFWHRWTALRIGAVAGLLMASFLWAAMAAAQSAETPKVEEKSRLLDSGDHVHILSVLRVDTEDEITVVLRIDDGFHINANPASAPYLIPTALVFKSVTPLRVLYPGATRFKPKFVDEYLDVYQGIVQITAIMPKGTLAGAPALRATLTVQACTDVICLPPADIPILTHS